MKYIILASLIFLAGCDKALHFGAGLAISTVVTDVTKSPELGCASAVVAGLAKEAIDFIPDPFDFAATAAGGCIDYQKVLGPTKKE
jgi:hypothetical protein